MPLVPCVSSHPSSQDRGPCMRVPGQGSHAALPHLIHGPLTSQCRLRVSSLHLMGVTEASLPPAAFSRDTPTPRMLAAQRRRPTQLGDPLTEQAGLCLLQPGTVEGKGVGKFAASCPGGSSLGHSSGIYLSLAKAALSGPREGKQSKPRGCHPPGSDEGGCVGARARRGGRGLPKGQHVVWDGPDVPLTGGDLAAPTWAGESPRGAVPSPRLPRAGSLAGLTWNFFLATKYCMRRMTLMVARWCSRSLRWGVESRCEWPPLLDILATL